jgi:signal transduction histidine kinase
MRCSDSELAYSMKLASPNARCASVRYTFRGELLASMAHELRAPLQGVSGFAEYLLEGKAGTLDQVQRTCLQQIELGAEHVLQVIQDVLDLTDRDVDTLQIRSEVVDTARAVREVMQVLQALAMRRRIGVHVQVDDRLGHVVCDATKLKQVLYNLISNALK